jgi:hypothetical protein
VLVRADDARSGSLALDNEEVEDDVEPGAGLGRARERVEEVAARVAPATVRSRSVASVSRWASEDERP